MADPAQVSSVVPAASALSGIVLAGLLGMLGQGVRVVAGLKKASNDAAAQNLGLAEVFMLSRLLFGLMVGFVAGVAAALALGIGKLVSIDTGSTSLLLGIAAAGYAGTDFIEAFLPVVAAGRPPAPAGGAGTADMAANAPGTGASGTGASGTGAGGAGAAGGGGAAVPGATGDGATGDGGAPGLAAAVQAMGSDKILAFANAALNLAMSAATATPDSTVFAALVPGGFFSSDPNAPGVPRAIRTNNPGALNFRPWQAARPGFVGKTAPDANGNVTTIYRTPEHGIAAWYHLIAAIYAFPNGTFSLADLARRYAGAQASDAEINAYVRGWTHFYRQDGQPTPPPDLISVTDGPAMRDLARAMFSHEAGRQTPVHDDQIDFAIRHEQDGTMPA